MMRLRKSSKILIVVLLSILVISLLPGVAMIWAEANSDLAKGGSFLQSLLPSLQGEEAAQRPPSNFEDMIIQDSDDPETISGQNDGSGVEIVPAAAFVHTGQLDNTTQAEDWFYYFNGGYVRNDSANQVCMAAPVQLSPGTVIRSFTVYVVDSSAASNLTVYLDRSASWDFDFDELAAVQSVGNSTGVQVLTDPSVANNIVLSEFNYYIDFCFPASSGSSIRLKGARVNYTPRDDVLLPILLSFPVVLPTTQLNVKNSSGGTVIYYRLRNLNTNEIVVSCPANIPNGQQVFCGAFTPGTYKVEGSFSACGSGSTNINFPAGNCVRTVTCPSEGGPPPSMVCN